MTKTQHKRTEVASMFQNGISQNTKCAERDGFCREGHIYDWACKNRAYLHKLHTFTKRYFSCSVLTIFKVL